MPDSGQILMNNRFYNADKAIFPANNRAFRYGDGIFETIRVTGSNVNLLDEHFERLTDSAEYLQLKLPDKWNKQFFEELILKTAEKNDVGEKARVRFSLFRADGGHYEPVNNDAWYLVEAESFPRKGYSINQKGLKIDLFTTIEKPVGLYSNLKSCNCLPFVLASLYKKEKKLDSCLITNTKNRVAEAISSNVFIVKDDKVLTPPLSEGCVAGVMRSKVLDVMAENGIPFQENPITLEELFVAGELFLTDAVHGIRWVGNYKIKEFGMSLTKEIAGLLDKKLKH